MIIYASFHLIYGLWISFVPIINIYVGLHKSQNIFLDMAQRAYFSYFTLPAVGRKAVIQLTDGRSAVEGRGRLTGIVSAYGVFDHQSVPLKRKKLR